MKGFTAIMSIIFCIAIAITAVYTYGIAAGVHEAAVKKISLEKDIYMLGNALEYSRLFLDISLKYAAYQSLFDYGQEQEYWVSTPSVEDFEKQISKKIQDNLDKYTEKKIEFVDENHMVGLPKYYSVDAVLKNHTLSMEALGDKIQISQLTPTEKIDLAKNSTLSFAVKYRLFDLARNFVLSKKLDEAVVISVPSAGELKLTGCENRGKDVSDISVFNSVYNSTFSTVEETQNFLISKQIEEANKIKPEDSNVSWEISILSNISSLDISCEPKIEDKCADSKTYTYTKTCTFDYKYNLNFSISITDLEKKYPVESGQLLDKKPNLENQKLTFKKSFNSN